MSQPFWHKPQILSLTTAMLPPVPNVPGLLGYSIVKSTMVEPPYLVLPSFHRLKDMGDHERAVRDAYWESFLLLGPLLMCALCEAVRVLTLYCRAARSSYTRILLAQEEGSAGPVDQSASSERILWCGCGLSLIAYHLLCIGLVAVSVSGDWISFNQGLAWELWAIWQHTCLWALFIQNLCRCCMASNEALQQSTVKTVLLYTMPFVSEVFDTMKDWIMAGVCWTLYSYDEVDKLDGLIWGLVIVGADLCVQCCADSGISVSGSIRVWPPLFTMKAFYAMLCCAVLVVLLVLFGGVIGIVVVYYSFLLFPFWPLAGCCVLIRHLRVNNPECLIIIGANAFLCILFIGPFGLLLAWIRGDEPLSDFCDFWEGWAYMMRDSWGPLNQFLYKLSLFDYMGHACGMLQVYKFWVSSSCLCVLAVYVIIYSYILVCRHAESALDIQKTYLGIWSLPPRAPQPLNTSLCEKAKITATNFFVDFLSTGRLLIAWAEDWPQGFIGILILIKMEGKGTAQFLWTSAAISLAKGVLIPAGQAAVVEAKRLEVQHGLDDLRTSDARRKFAQSLESRGQWSRSQLPGALQDVLRECVDDLMASRNVRRDRDAYAPLFDLGSKWVQSTCSDESYINEVEVAYVQLLCPRTLTLARVRELGYAKVCRMAGFSLEECLKAGLTAAECREAGFTAADWKSGGLSIYDCKAGGYVAKDCKEAGFTAHECRKAGFNTHECHAAGFPPPSGQVQGLELLTLAVPSETGLTDAQWLTFRAPISRGKYYFEVELFSNVARPQIGVITTDFQSSDKGIGNDREGWAFLDGQRQEHLRGGRAMSVWKAGDVLGLAVDFESGIMCLSQNGTWLDDAVYTKQIDAKKRLYPAVSMSGFFQMRLSKSSWHFKPPGTEYQQWGTGIFKFNEADPSMKS
ncbi:unnamed protein product [Symbiodinium sp. KB8]|nr:unnamed protein product [Symbiodinium sp. KB8]